VFGIGKKSPKDVKRPSAPREGEATVVFSSDDPELSAAGRGVDQVSGSGGGQQSGKVRTAQPSGQPGGLGGVISMLATAIRGGSGSRRWSVWRIAIVAGLVYVAAFSLSYFVVLKPVWGRLDVLRSKKGVIQDFLIVRESSGAVSSFKDALMRGDQRMTILASIQEMASASGVRIVSDPQRLSPAQLSPRVVEYPIELDVEGTYNEIGEFLGLIESGQRYLAVKEVEADSRESASGEASAVVVVGALSWEE